jgi:hypothetical protein
MYSLILFYQSIHKVLFYLYIYIFAFILQIFLTIWNFLYTVSVFVYLFYLVCQLKLSFSLLILSLECFQCCARDISCRNTDLYRLDLIHIGDQQNKFLPPLSTVKANFVVVFQQYRLYCAMKLHQ